MLWLGSSDGSRLILLAFAILLMSLSLAMTMSRSGIIAFAVALMLTTWVVARSEAPASKRVLASVAVLGLGIAGTAWAGVDALVTRFLLLRGSELGGRLAVWRDAARIVRDFAVTGTGLNTYGTATRVYQTTRADVHYMEAHNDYLQLAVEGGILVAVPVAIVLALLVREVRRRFAERMDDPINYWIRVGAVTGLVAIAGQELVEFSLQMPGNAALFAVLCAMAIRHGEGRGRAASSRLTRRIHDQ